MAKHEFTASIEFSIPDERVLAIARKLAAAEAQDHRTIAQALIDTTAASLAMQERMTKAAPANEVCDFGPYFNHQIGEALDPARRLVASNDSDVREVAASLMSQADAIARSKSAFLAEAQRHGLKAPPDPQP